MIEEITKIAARANRLVTAESKRLKLERDEVAPAVIGALTLAIVTPGQEPGDLEARFQEWMKSESEEGSESEVTSYRDTVIDRTVRPTYDKAKKQGANPVPALQVLLGISEEAAKTLVADLEDQEQSVAADPFASVEQDETGTETDL